MRSVYVCEKLRGRLREWSRRKYGSMSCIFLVTQDYQIDLAYETHSFRLNHFRMRPRPGIMRYGAYNGRVWKMRQ